MGAVGDLANRAGSLQQVGDRLSGIGQAMTTRATLPIVGALGLATYQAVNFQSSMADVRKVLGLSREDAQAMGQDFLAMSRTLPISAEGLAAIAASGGQLGITADQIGDFTQLTARMSTAFDMSAEQAGDAIARMMNVYSLADLSQVEHVGDVVNRLSDTSAAASSEIVESMTRIGGATRTFGLSADQSAALATAFISLGDAPEVAATAINAFLPMLQTATGQTPKFQEALAGIGISAQEMQAAVQQDGIGAIQMFLGALGDLDAQSRALAINQMFGTGADARALLKLANDSSQLEKALGTLADTSEVNGSMMREFETRADTTANQLQRLRNMTTEVAITVGTALLPALNGIVTAIMPMVQGFADFAAANPGIVKIAAAIALVVAAIGPLLIVIGSVVSAVGTMVTAFSAGGVLAGVGTAIAAGFSMASAALSAFIATAISIGSVVALVGGVSYAIFALGSQLSGTTLTFSDFLSTIRLSLMQLPANLAQLPAAIGAIFSLIGTTVRMTLLNLELTIRMAMLRAAMSIQAAWGGLVGFFASIWGSIRAAVVGAIGGMVSAISSGGSRAVAAISTMGSAILATVRGLAGAMMSAGANIVSSLVQGIMSRIGQARAAISSIASTIRGAMPFSPAKYGPLTDIMEVGPNIVRFIADGMSPAPVAAAMQRTLMPAREAMNPTGAGLGAGLSPTTGAGQAGGTSSIALTYAPTVNLGAGDGVEGRFAELLSEHKDEIERLLDGMARRRERVAYG